MLCGIGISLSLSLSLSLSKYSIRRGFLPDCVCFVSPLEARGEKFSDLSSNRVPALTSVSFHFLHFFMLHTLDDNNV